jgi:hypothetical protein
MSHLALVLGEIPQWLIGMKKSPEMGVLATVYRGSEGKSDWISHSG